MGPAMNRFRISMPLILPGRRRFSNAMVRSDRSASGNGLDYIGTIVSTLVQPVESVLMNPLCVSRTNAR